MGRWRLGFRVSLERLNKAQGEAVDNGLRLLGLHLTDEGVKRLTAPSVLHFEELQRLAREFSGPWKVSARSSGLMAPWRALGLAPHRARRR